MSNYSDKVLSLLPVAYWRLGEAAGANTVVDEIGNHNGIYLNTPTLEIPGLIYTDADTAMRQLAANNEKLHIVNDSVIADTDDFTFCMHVKFEGVNDQPTFLRGTDGSGAWSVHLYMHSNGVTGALVTISGGQIGFSVTAAFTPVIGKTYFLAFSFEQGVALRLYVNGVLVDTLLETSTILRTSSYGIHTGTLGSTLISNDGTLDELIIFDKVLTDLEISDLHNTSTYPPIFTGEILDQTGIAGEQFSYDASPHFESGGEVVTYSLQNAPVWADVDNTGLIFGDMVGGNVSGITVTAINSAGTAVSNTFAILVSYTFSQMQVIDFVIEIVDTPILINYAFSQIQVIDYSLEIALTHITQNIKLYSILASDPIWDEGTYPDFEYVLGALPIDRVPAHFGPVDETTFVLAPTVLLGNVIRNDYTPIDRWENTGVLAEAPLLYFYGCDVTPKEIVIPGVIDADYFVPIQISNNHLGQSIEIRDLFIIDDPFGTMEITPQDWPRLLDPYSVATYTLKISATEGYPSFSATLVVDAGTCYTEIPITGSRNVECPICPECPPPCPPEETEDMPSCMIEQELCAISRGDTVPFSFVFVTPTGAAMDISNMQLEFTLKLDVKQEIPDLIKTITFPADADSIAGIGSMKITPAETLELLAGAGYCFKFKLISGPDDVYTIGLGTVKVNPDPPTPIE